jgi:lactoylglutathione lyase
MQLRYIILYVADVPAAMAFYEAAFGLTRLFLHEGGDYGEMATGATRLAFSAHGLMRQLGKTPGEARPEAPVFELAFETEDVAGSYARALAAGARPMTPPQDQPWGQTISYVSDPNGYLVEICSPVAGGS